MVTTKDEHLRKAVSAKRYFDAEREFDRHCEVDAPRTVVAAFDPFEQFGVPFKCQIAVHYRAWRRRGSFRSAYL